MTGSSFPIGKQHLMPMLSVILSLVLAILFLLALIPDAPDQIEEQSQQEQPKPDQPQPMPPEILPEVAALSAASISLDLPPPPPAAAAASTPPKPAPAPAPEQAAPASKPAVIEPLQKTQMAEKAAPEPAHPYQPLSKTAPRRSSLPRGIAIERPEPETRPIEPAFEPLQASRKRAETIAESLPSTAAAPSPGQPTKEPANTATVAANTDRALQQEGRVLLNLLEHGKGPDIRISWPEQAAARDRLYNLFSQCLGMKSALWVEPAQIYDAHHRRGESAPIDASKYSLFLRAPFGVMPGDEKWQLDRIARRHGNHAAAARPARLFPRKLDAVLLGGLQRLAGQGYHQAKTVTAAYQLKGQSILLTDINLDGKPVSGAIQLASGPYYACAGGA